MTYAEVFDVEAGFRTLTEDERARCNALLAEMQEENPLQISAVCRLVLGKAQRKALYDHLRTEDGRVPADQVSAALNEIFLALGPDAKN